MLDKGIDHLLTLKKKYDEEICADIFMINSCPYDDIKNKYIEQMDLRKETKNKICKLIDTWDQSHLKINLLNVLEMDDIDCVQRLRNIVRVIENCSMTLLYGKIVSISTETFASRFSQIFHHSNAPSISRCEITDCVDIFERNTIDNCLKEISLIDECYSVRRKSVNEKLDYEKWDKNDLLVRLGTMRYHGVVLTQNYNIDSEINELIFEYLYQCEMIKK